MNFQPLYTTARVVSAIYKVASTTLLLIYLARRVADGREFANKDRPHERESEAYSWGNRHDEDGRGRMRPH